MWSRPALEWRVLVAALMQDRTMSLLAIKHRGES